MAKTTKSKDSALTKTAAKSPEENTASALVETLDVSGARRVFLAAQNKLSGHEPSAALRARLDAQIDRASAIAIGIHLASESVLYDAMTDLPLVLDAIAARKIQGFGPKEAHYTLSLALALESAWSSLNAHQVQRAGVASTKALTLSAASEVRTALLALVETVVVPGSSASASLVKAASFGGKRLREVAQGLDIVVKTARDLLQSATTDPALAELLEDKGLTATVVDTAAAYSTRLSEAVTGHAETRSAVELGHNQLDELDGRLREQLFHLRRAVQQARRNGVIVPEVTLANLRRLHRKPRAPAAPAPTPA